MVEILECSNDCLGSICDCWCDIMGCCMFFCVDAREGYIAICKKKDQQTSEGVIP